MSAARAAICALALIGISFFINQGLGLAYQSSTSFTAWARANWHAIEATVILVNQACWLALAVLLGGGGSWADLWRQWGLAHRPTLFGWLLGSAALLIGTLWVLLEVFASPSEAALQQDAFETGRTAWSFYVLERVLIGPFIEETVCRGYLFPAFRTLFGICPSTAC